MYQGKEKVWEREIAALRNEILKPVDGRMIVEFGKEVEAKATAICSNSLKRRSPSERVCVRLRVFDHLSVVRNRQEVWCIVEINLSDSTHGDLYLDDLAKELIVRKENFAIKSGDDLAQPVMPHPVSEEFMHKLAQKKDLKPNRRHPEVNVPFDGLTADQRSALYDFVLVDKTKKLEHQIERVVYRSQSAPAEFSDAKLFRLVSERVPVGSVLSVEQLNLKIGDVCKELRYYFPDLHTSVTLEEDQNKNTVMIVSVLSPSELGSK